MFFLELHKVAVEQSIVFCLKFGVGIKDKGCCVASQLHELTVSSQIGKFQVEGNAALLCSLQIARAT